MTYPARNTGPQSWDEGNVEKGFERLVEDTLDSNGYDSDLRDMNRDERGRMMDTVVGLGVDFKEDEEEFWEFRDTLFPLLDNGTGWFLGTNNSRDGIMTQAGEAVREDKPVTFEMKDDVRNPKKAIVNLSYEDGDVEARVDMELDEESIPYQLRKVLSSPEEAANFVPEDAAQQVDYNRVLNEQFGEIVSEYTENLDADVHVNTEADHTNPLSVSMDNPSGEELYDLLDSLYESREDLSKLHDRLTWNMVQSSPFRDEDEYGRAMI